MKLSYFTICTMIFALVPALMLGQFGPSPQQIEQMKKAATLPTPKTADGHPDLNGYWGFNAMAASLVITWVK